MGSIQVFMHGFWWMPSFWGMNAAKSNQNIMICVAKKSKELFSGRNFSITFFLRGLKTKSKRRNMKQSKLLIKMNEKESTKEYSLCSLSIIIFNNVLCNCQYFTKHTQRMFYSFLMDIEQKMLISVNYAECSNME